MKMQDFLVFKVEITYNHPGRIAPRKTSRYYVLGC
jgi:hypothetical protein